MVNRVFVIAALCAALGLLAGCARSHARGPAQGQEEPEAQAQAGRPEDAESSAEAELYSCGSPVRAPRRAPKFSPSAGRAPKRAPKGSTETRGMVRRPSPVGPELYAASHDETPTPKALWVDVTSNPKGAAVYCAYKEDGPYLRWHSGTGSGLQTPCRAWLKYAPRPMKAPGHRLYIRVLKEGWKTPKPRSIDVREPSSHVHFELERAASP